MATISSDQTWTKPAAMAIPKEGYFKFEQSRYGPLYPRTPACHGFTIIAKIKPGTEDKIRAHGKKIEETIAASPHALATLQLHYLRWVLFDIGPDKYFMYQGISRRDQESPRCEGRVLVDARPDAVTHRRRCGAVDARTG